MEKFGKIIMQNVEISDKIVVDFQKILMKTPGLYQVQKLRNTSTTMDTSTTTTTLNILTTTTSEGWGMR